MATSSAGAVGLSPLSRPASGLPSATIVDLLPCITSGTTTPAMIDRIRAEHARLDEQVRTLSATRERLTSLLAEANRRLVA